MASRWSRGLPRSTRREFNNKLSLVPAGRRFHAWQEPSVLARVTYFHIDPAGPLLDPQLRFSELELAPRLFFEDIHLWSTAAKLKSEIEYGGSNPLYAEALSQVLVLELVRLRNGAPAPLQQHRGGLAGCQRMVLDYLETHLAEPLSLAALAEIAGIFGLQRELVDLLGIGGLDDADRLARQVSGVLLVRGNPNQSQYCGTSDRKRAAKRN